MENRDIFSWNPATGTRGHNRDSDFWHVAFKGKPETIVPIKNFLDRHAGHREFLWTPPAGEQGIYRSFDIIVTRQAPDTSTLSTVFENARTAHLQIPPKRHFVQEVEYA